VREGTYLISPLARVVASPAYIWVAETPPIVKSRYPFASSAVCPGVLRPDPGCEPAGDRGANDMVSLSVFLIVSSIVSSLYMPD
jgi:hypothetical protein